MLLVSLSLVIFAGFAATWQLIHYDGSGKGISPESCIVLSYNKGKKLAGIHDLVPRVGVYRPGVASWWTLDLALPEDASIFITDMTGPTNGYKIMYYYAASYYLFPREVGVSLDHHTGFAKDCLYGTTSASDQEILAHGYDVRLDFAADEKMFYKALRGFPTRNLANPDWFDSISDAGIAFLLPLLTALTGMWLFRFLFPGLGGQVPLWEQLAGGLGLGMMAVAAVTLGIKLCGLNGYHLVHLAVTVGGIAEIWRDRGIFQTRMVDSTRKLVRRPVLIAILVAGSLVFLVLFRLAGLQGVVDPDATAGWLLKAKILHGYAGNEMVQWFSNPRLAQAHLDYPTLVSALHAATYDSLGHADEFVTKFWPTWMLFFLVAALAALNPCSRCCGYAPLFGLLGLLLLPVIQKFVQMEGSTMPMIFFTVMGFVQCGFWLVGKDPSRLSLGLTLLFGAAMTKFEGMIFLALVGAWLLLLPSARPSFKRSSCFWRVTAFWFFAALPYLALRTQIPVLNYESNWAGYAMHHPGSMLSSWPGFFMILLARLFVNSDWASWSGEGGQFHWDGRWDGLASLYNPSTLGLAWICLLITAALWFAAPARRPAILWVLAVIVSAAAALSGVFASFVNLNGLEAVLGYTADAHAGRYFLPMLVAWFATMMTLFFMEPPAQNSPPNATPPASADVKVESKTLEN